jgi:protein-L-isoaspartate O-methyltransferase
MWDERYAAEEYIYGTEPNEFLAEHARELSGPVLCIAEGEGRNGVFLASLGLEVLAVDSSAVGLEKARALAESRGVSIATEVADLADYVPSPNTFGAVVSIFAHLPSKVRQRLYPLLEQCLTPGGLLILEAYNEAQINRDTGGPKDPDMLMSEAKIETGFANLDTLFLRDTRRQVVEGLYHTGLADVVQFIGRKPTS